MNIKCRRISEVNINVAPLVEVMLVLIIIFMLTAPTMNVGVDVDLPKTNAGELSSSQNPPVMLSINKSGEIFLDEKKISMNDLIEKLPHILRSGNTDTVYIRGDKNLSYGTIMEIMGIISSSGSCKVSLVSEPSTINTKQIEDVQQSSGRVTKLPK